MALKPDDTQVTGREVTEQATPPTAAAGAGAGTAPPAPVVASKAADEHGSLTFGTGSAVSGGTGAVIVTVTLNQGLGSNSESVATVTPTNDATEVLGISVVNHYIGGELTSFDICSHTAAASSQANTIYAADWVCA